MGGKKIAGRQSLRESESWSRLLVILKALRGIVKFIYCSLWFKKCEEKIHPVCGAAFGSRYFCAC